MIHCFIPVFSSFWSRDAIDPLQPLMPHPSVTSSHRAGRHLLSLPDTLVASSGGENLNLSNNHEELEKKVGKIERF